MARRPRLGRPPLRLWFRDDRPSRVSGDQKGVPIPRRLTAWATDRARPSVEDEAHQTRGNIQDLPGAQWFTTAAFGAAFTVNSTVSGVVHCRMRVGPKLESSAG